MDAADAEIQLLEAVDPAPRFIAVSGLRKDVAGKVLHFADIGDLRIAFVDARAFIAEIARELFVEPCGEIVVHAVNEGFGRATSHPKARKYSMSCSSGFSAPTLSTQILRMPFSYAFRSSAPVCASGMLLMKR